MTYLLQQQNFEAFATIPNAFTDYEINVIRDMMSCMLTGGIGKENLPDKQLRESRIRWIHSCIPHNWIFERVRSIIHDVNPKYFGMDLTHTESIQLTEYDAEYQGFYGVHTDCSYDNGNARTRKLSITVQLSDPSEYEGGELNLYWNNLKQPAIASKSKGAMTLFRSHILHEVSPVTKGKRLSFVTWVNGPLFR